MPTMAIKSKLNLDKALFCLNAVVYGQTFTPRIYPKETNFLVKQTTSETCFHFRTHQLIQTQLKHETLSS